MTLLAHSHPPVVYTLTAHTRAAVTSRREKNIQRMDCVYPTETRPILNTSLTVHDDREINRITPCLLNIPEPL